MPLGGLARGADLEWSRGPTSLPPTSLVCHPLSSSPVTAPSLLLIVYSLLLFMILVLQLVCFLIARLRNLCSSLDTWFRNLTFACLSFSFSFQIRWCGWSFTALLVVFLRSKLLSVRSKLYWDSYSMEQLPFYLRSIVYPWSFVSLFWGKQQSNWHFLVGCIVSPPAGCAPPVLFSAGPSY